MPEKPHGDEIGNKPPPSLMSLEVPAPKEVVAGNAEPTALKLPDALEQALAYKNTRAKEIGISIEEAEKIENEGIISKDADRPQSERHRTVESFVSSYYENDADVEQNADKDGKRKKKKKKKKKGFNRFEEELRKKKEQGGFKNAFKRKEKKVEKPKNEETDVIYVSGKIDLDLTDPMNRHFAKIFETFKISEPEVKVEIPIAEKMDSEAKKKEEKGEDSDEEEEMAVVSEKKVLSKRKLKIISRMSVAELKQTVTRPDVVEMHDVTARDPKLLVHLKASKNTVPVPRHWCFKRKYLQGKRGIEKPPFELPEFIKKTGIMEMRAALQEKEDQKTLKSKMREKVRPKMGKIDIDYQKLHDAFFKWQTKPKMSIHGDLYYEGKEFETKMKDKKPGEMSDDLRIALGMPVGANAQRVPPPWLIAMQRYGPPPSYPNLKIPGLNAPIPENCSFGYHAGGWGKPPVDNMGKPIYGDVFGNFNKEPDLPLHEEESEKTLWGELESESEESSEESEGEGEDTSGLVTPGDTGAATPSGMTSLPVGLETPDLIELRKKRLETELEGGDTPAAALYHVLPEKRAENIGRAMMGSAHTYDLSAAAPGTGPKASGYQVVDVALDPSELDLVDSEHMAARYEATLRQQQQGTEEDFSDMVAEHAAKQKNKRRKQQDTSKSTKKYKDFKF